MLPSRYNACFFWNSGSTKWLHLCASSILFRIPKWNSMNTKLDTESSSRCYGSLRHFLGDFFQSVDTQTFGKIFGTWYDLLGGGPVDKYIRFRVQFENLGVLVTWRGLWFHGREIRFEKWCVGGYRPGDANSFAKGVYCKHRKQQITPTNIQNDIFVLEIECFSIVFTKVATLFDIAVWISRDCMYMMCCVCVYVCVCAFVCDTQTLQQTAQLKPNPSNPSRTALRRFLRSCSSVVYSGRSSWLKHVCEEGRRPLSPHRWMLNFCRVIGICVCESLL